MVYNFNKKVLDDETVEFDMFVRGSASLILQKGDNIPDADTAERMLRDEVWRELNRLYFGREPILSKEMYGAGQAIAEGIRSGIESGTPRRSGRFPWKDGFYCEDFQEVGQARERLNWIREKADKNGFVTLRGIDERYKTISENNRIGWTAADLREKGACAVILRDDVSTLRLPVPRKLKISDFENLGLPSEDRVQGRVRSPQVPPCGKPDIVFESMNEARKVGTELRHILKEYGVATLSDLYDLAGIPSTYEDTRYGWLEFPEKFAYGYTNRGIRISLPPVTHIEMKNPEFKPEKTPNVTDAQFSELMRSKYSGEALVCGDEMNKIASLMADMIAGGATTAEMRRVIRISREIMDDAKAERAKVAN